MLDQALQRFIRIGRLAVVFASGRVGVYGDGSGPAVRVGLSKRGARRLMLNPGLAVGEAYMDGDLIVLEGSFWNLMELIGRNVDELPAEHGMLGRLFHRCERIAQQWNDRRAARRNVRRHYDLSYELYRRFLDADLQYSCAYFTEEGMTLEAAQVAKKALLARKLVLSAGMSVLDVGSGWGGLALTLAQSHQVVVTGVTLSQEQLEIARARAAEQNLDGRVRFELADYRDLRGPFDRIVSVGMLEHVGARNLGAYFRQISRLLSDDGVAVIHAIGGHGPPGVTQPFIRKHIFPGGYIPSLSEVAAAIEPTGLWITDVEILRLHYAQTLRCWRERFLAERAAIAGLYDERFCRMWEAYLCMSELAFRYLSQMVFQIQLTKRVDTLPVTRDYLLGAALRELGDESASVHVPRPVRIS